MAKTKSVQQLELVVKPRQAQGSRPVRRLRREGVIPGVVYGRDMKPVSVVVERKALAQVLHSKAGEHALVKLRMQEGSPWEKPALVKTVQHHPVHGHVMHVDFHAVLLTERLKIKVPVVLKGEPVGVKQDGGILEHFLRDVEVECLPTEIPSSVEFDVSALKIGETIHVKDLTAPTNAKITSEPEGVIASVQKPKEEKPEEEAAAVTEPEVLREKKEEAEAETPASAGKAEPAAKEEKKEKEK